MRAWLYVGTATVLGAAFVAILTLHVLSPFSALVVSDVCQIVAPTLAALLCFRAARRREYGHPRSWTALGIGVGGWAVGQSVWTYYEVVQDSEVPFPSLADVGFLVFPLAAAYGLVNWLGTQDTVVARGRDVLDGVIIALSLLVLSWVMALDAAIDESSADWTAAALSMLYPVGDVILVTLALMALARGRSGERLVLAILALGIGFLAFADSAYVYLVSLGEYTSHDWASGGWVLRVPADRSCRSGRRHLALVATTATASARDDRRRQPGWAVPPGVAVPPVHRGRVGRRVAPVAPARVGTPSA